MMAGNQTQDQTQEVLNLKHQPYHLSVMGVRVWSIYAKKYVGQIKLLSKAQIYICNFLISDVISQFLLQSIKILSLSLSLLQILLRHLSAVGTPQIESPFKCGQCGKSYLYKKSMLRHLRLECGKEPQFYCRYCPHRTKHKSSLLMHITNKHREVADIAL